MIGASCAKGGTGVVEGIAKSSRDSLPRHYGASKHTYSVCFQALYNILLLHKIGTGS